MSDSNSFISGVFCDFEAPDTYPTPSRALMITQIPVKIVIPILTVCDNLVGIWMIIRACEGVGYVPGASKSQKTPEMNELESDKIPLKIWASNFEKQKS